MCRLYPSQTVRRFTLRTIAVPEVVELKVEYRVYERYQDDL